jgi:hypothetical protein
MHGRIDRLGRLVIHARDGAPPRGPASFLPQCYFILILMGLDLQVQEKAQAEIDSVTGRTRLPRMSDKAAMPYLCSIVWETFRWSPPVPVSAYSFPHLIAKS